jgi:ABC-2 type transport system permease protein
MISVNNPALALNTLAADAGLLTPRRALAAYLTEIRFEFMRLLRNPALLIPVVLVPLALYLLFAVVIWGDAVAKDAGTAIFFFCAFSVMAVTMPALFSISSSLAMEREMGLMRLRRAQPAPAGSWLVAKIVCGVVFCLLAYLPMLAAALLAGTLPLGAGQIVSMSLALVAGAIPFCALGLMMGALVKGSAAPGFANIIYLPGCYLSGLFFPLKASMLSQAHLWPQFYVNQLAMQAVGITKPYFVSMQMAIGALLGFTVLFSAVAIWRLARKG